MHLFRCFLLILLAIGFELTFAQNINIQPKYGLLPKNDAQKTADAEFISSIDDYYKGNRKQGAEDIAARGWELLRKNNITDAMRRFNQAWLLDNSNGKALWGMAVVQVMTGKIAESLKLFYEAERSIGDDIDFSVDYAKTIGVAGAQTKNAAILQEAFVRFERLYQKAPQHTLNLQNWAITLFHVGNYPEAWKKLKLAEETPRHAELDPSFSAALQNKMPRP